MKFINKLLSKISSINIPSLSMAVFQSTVLLIISSSSFITDINEEEKIINTIVRYGDLLLYAIGIYVISYIFIAYSVVVFPMSLSALLT